MQVSKLRSLLSAGVFGLALIVARSSFAQPDGAKPGPPEAQAPGQANVPGTPKAATPGTKRADVRTDEGRGKAKGKRGERARDDKGKKGKKGRKGKKTRKGPSKRDTLQAKKDAGTALTEDEKQELERLWAVRLELAKKRQGPHFETFFPLLEKQKDGKLSAEERVELDKLKVLRKRHRGLAHREAKRDKNRPQRVRRAKRNLLRRFPGLLDDDAARAELRKHAEREAMLSRALEVARAEGLTDVMKRVEILRTKERARHGEWMKEQFAKAKQGDKK
jgi:hypothetical protein